MTPFGWRFAAVVFGSLLVFFTIRLARRLSRSTLIGAVAGLLLTFDGLAFVMSRLALLDVFQATFAVAAVAALVADRDWFRNKLADHLERRQLPDLEGRFGPLLRATHHRLDSRQAEAAHTDDDTPHGPASRDQLRGQRGGSVAVAEDQHMHGAPWKSRLAAKMGADGRGGQADG